jgi:hypothetical protein
MVVHSFMSAGLSSTGTLACPRDWLKGLFTGPTVVSSVRKMV